MKVGLGLQRKAITGVQRVENDVFDTTVKVALSTAAIVNKELTGAAS